MKSHPNIIYILADDMGYGDCSCLNKNSKIKTTHIDRMAANGMCFTDAHSSSAVCTPSRYSILTGRYSWRSWLKEGVVMGYSKPVIEDNRMTVASLLKEHGYRTACIGKWHLGWNWARSEEDSEKIDFTVPISKGPTDNGFDYFFGISASLDMPPYCYIENERVTAVPDRMIDEQTGKQKWRAGEIAPDFRHEECLPRLTEKALSYILNSKGNQDPYFLYFALPAPHTPILPAAEFQGKSGLNEYGDFCLMLDDVVGQIRAAVEDSGESDHTIIIFTSDNGCSPEANFDELLRFGHNPSYDYRGHKADIYEGGHRVPLIVEWPENIQPGSLSHETVCLVDLLATCADIVGVALPDDAGEDSFSNLPIWVGDNSKVGLREGVVHHSFDGSFAIRQGSWKLEMCPGSGGWSYPASENDTRELPRFQLYNLEDDIGEKDNLHFENKEIVEEMTRLLTRYIENGRSSLGLPQKNEEPSEDWSQLWWMENPAMIDESLF
ncbi:MAG: arylsulfatase [Verrucomicrobiota bacterium]